MKKQDVAIRVHNLYKSFDLAENKITTIKQAFVSIGKSNRKARQHVLNGIDFEVRQGDFFGVVGKNGSGKSTLLKILAGVYSPDSGAVELNGNLTPFIELGVGFNPELSGRDNVYLSSSLLGYSRKQVDNIYQDIVDFAELQDHMDKKLKNYSSGMQVRLAFSIAIKAKNDILIFDEVLAVGDEAFQRKCLDVFREYKKQKQTVVLVTHSMDVVKAYCNRAILIDGGRIVKEGDTVEVSDMYISLNEEHGENSINLIDDFSDVKITADLIDQNGKKRNKFKVGELAGIKLKWQENTKLDLIMFDLFKSTGEHITGFKSRADGVAIKKKLSTIIELELNLSPGYYKTKISFRNSADQDLRIMYDVGFEITEWGALLGKDWAGLTRVEHRWRF